MHAGNDDVHLLEYGIGEVKRSIGQNVHLDTSENSYFALLGFVIERVVHRADSLDVLNRALVIQAIGECQVLRMVGDSHVLVTMFGCSFGHLFNGVAPVSLDSVHMHVATQVSLCDQHRQSVICRSVEFAEIFA